MRATVYKAAEEHLAFCVDHDTAIRYEGDDLKVDIYFKEEAAAMKFETSVNNWNYDRPLRTLEPAPQSEPVQDVPSPNNLVRVRLQQYNPARYPKEEGGSPVESLADIQGPLSSAAPSEAALDTDLAKFQSIEKPELLRYGGTKTYKLHLKNQGKMYGHEKSLKNNEDNMLAGTWLFHQHFDGLNHDMKMPSIAIKPGAVEETVEFSGHKRRKVVVEIEFHDDQAETAISPMLKTGSEKSTPPLRWRSFVHVRDAKTFKDCLQWKYEDTKAKWRQAEDLLNASDKEGESEQKYAVICCWFYENVLRRSHMTLNPHRH